jgi:hypothetical protein
MDIMKNMTRKQFLKTVAAGVAGAIIPGFISGCSILGQSQRQAFRPVKILAFGDMHCLNGQ